MSDVTHACCALQDGWSALMIASTNDCPDVAAKLITAGAQLDPQNEVRGSGVACGRC